MHGIRYDAASLPAVEAALRAALERGAAELEPDGLLLALIGDAVVRDALARCGVAPESVERAVAAWPRSTALPGEEVTIAPATWLVLHRAEQAAFVREHALVEPGHLLLGMLDDPASDGARLLAAAGADLPVLAAAIDRMLPGDVFDVERHRAEAEGHPPLSQEAVERLLEDLGEWRKALRSLRERRRAIAAGETPRVADDEVEAVKQHAREHAAWIALTDHHRHLAIAAADAHAPEHTFGFTYRIAFGALSHACRRYDGPATQADFERALHRAVDTALERAFREVVRARHPS